MKTILFQGDSITDCGRGNGMGTGYPLLTSSQLGFENQKQYKFYNRGISGNRVVDVYARIKSDIINLKPDYMSILIGVNDVWHELDWQNGVDAEKYERIYEMLISEVKQELPDIKIMILEPFCLKSSATENTDTDPNRWNTFSSEVKKRAQKSKAIAEKFGLPFIPLQGLFDEAAKSSDVEYWLFDGVHPTMNGHELIKREWIKTFNTIK